VEDNGAELIEVRISEVLDTAFSCSKREWDKLERLLGTCLLLKASDAKSPAEKLLILRRLSYV
jgi:hypothetical protein